MERTRTHAPPMLALLLLSSGALSGCWCFGCGPREPGTCQGDIQYVETDYLGARSSVRSPSRGELGTANLCGKRFTLAGFAPCGAGRHPVVLFVPGTFTPYNHVYIFRVLERLARNGYVALSADYANYAPFQGCDLYFPRAHCLFNAASSQSASARACSLPQADCSSGIAVLGHSQGGVIAALAADFDPRVRWVHAMSITAHPPPTARDLDCVLPSRRRLSADRLLVACGDCDLFFNGTKTNSCRTRSDGVTSGLERLTGIRCGSDSSCTWKMPGAGERAGWIKVPSQSMADGEAGHCYMFHDGCLGLPNENWLNDPDLPWGLPAILDDLRKALPPAPSRELGPRMPSYGSPP